MTVSALGGAALDRRAGDGEGEGEVLTPTLARGRCRCIAEKESAMVCRVEVVRRQLGAQLCSADRSITSLLLCSALLSSAVLSSLIPYLTSPYPLSFQITPPSALLSTPSHRA